MDTQPQHPNRLYHVVLLACITLFIVFPLLITLLALQEIHNGNSGAGWILWPTVTSLIMGVPTITFIMVAHYILQRKRRTPASLSHTGFIPAASPSVIIGAQSTPNAAVQKQIRTITLLGLVAFFGPIIFYTTVYIIGRWFSDNMAATNISKLILFAGFPITIGASILGAIEAWTTLRKLDENRMVLVLFLCLSPMVASYLFYVFLTSYYG